MGSGAARGIIGTRGSDVRNFNRWSPGPGPFEKGATILNFKAPGPIRPFGFF